MTDQTFARHARRTLVLAWPMILSRVGLVTMSMIDVVVLGRAGAGALAEYVLGQAVYDSLIGMSVGLLLGVPVLVAREIGAENPAAAPHILRRGLGFAAGLGLSLCLGLQFSGTLYALTGQDPALAGRAARVTSILAMALPWIGLYYVSASYLEAWHRPLPGFVAIAAANLCNLGFNVVFVFGLGPIPALGAPGCALATVLTFALAALGLMVYLWRDIANRPDPASNAGRAIAARVPPVREFARIGLASGGSFLFEAASFAILILFIGRLGALALAAHGVLFQFLAFTFMIAFGFAGATQVRVGNAWGRGDRAGIAQAGWVGLGLACLATGGLMLAIGFWRVPLVGLFTDAAAVAAAALPLIGWIMLAMIFDGGQTVLNSACRGRGDTWVPTAFQFVNYILIMVPAAWIFAFPLGQGLAGIYQGIALASVFSMTALGLRFRRLSVT